MCVLCGWVCVVMWHMCVHLFVYHECVGKTFARVRVCERVELIVSTVGESSILSQ